jgi:hypothetical protein
MAYVDLNPIRAGMAKDLITSVHTSVRQRMQRVQAKKTRGNAWLRPLVGITSSPGLSVRAHDYLELVDWSGRVVREGKRGSIALEVPSVLAQLGLRELQWQSQMLGIESRYWRAVGTAESLIAKARVLGQCWLKGAGRSIQVSPGCD